MEQLYLIGFIIFFVILLVTHFINEKALKLLNTEEKAKLIEEFAGLRKYFMLGLVMVVILFILAVQLNLNSTQELIVSIVYLAILIGLVIAINVLSYKKLKKLKFPAKYIKTFLFISFLKYIAILIIFAAILLNHS